MTEEDEAATLAGVERTEKSRWFSDLDKIILPTVLGLALLALALTDPMFFAYALIGILVLSPSVLIHEWGHYRVAKRAGLDVKEFSIGFGKRLTSKVDRHGVRWSLRAVPLGGSVEVAGMTVEEVEADAVPRERAYIYASVLTRLRLVLAGVLMNTLLGWVAIMPVAVYMSPGGFSWRSVLVAPLAAAISLVGFIALAFFSLVSTLFHWNADTGSILMLPSSIQEGMAHATATGMPLWVYFCMIVSLLNISLAVFNTLPLYPLDGFHAFVANLDGARTLRARMKGARGAIVEPLRKAQMSTYSKVTGTALSVFVVCLVGKDVIRLALMG